MSDRVLATLDGGILTATLNRPEKKNAIDTPMIDALLTLLERADLDAAVRVVALRGAGGDFCAGMDLNELLASADKSVQENRQAALHFARYAARVNMVVREDSLKAFMSNYLIDRIRDEPKIEVLSNTEVTALHGDRTLQAITLRNNKTGKEWTAQTNWLFLCLGGVPQTQWAAEAGVLCDSEGYIITGPDLPRNSKPPKNWTLDRNPFDMETSLPGVFAAGDVRAGSIKRCASAVGEGARTIASVHRYLADA